MKSNETTFRVGQIQIHLIYEFRPLNNQTKLFRSSKCVFKRTVPKMYYRSLSLTHGTRSRSNEINDDAKNSSKLYHEMSLFRPF